MEAQDEAREAQKRAISRDFCRQDLYTFTRYMFRQRHRIPWLQAPHHPIICDALMRVFQGDSKRLIINIAPRYSKTELAVVNFMAWALGKVPDAEFIHTSYSADLAGDNAWKARDIVEDPEYQAIFPETRLRPETKSRDHWKTTAGGHVYAKSSGMPITGFGAGKAGRETFGGAIVIDDPHKADEALSDTKRNAVIRWFQNTLENRKNDPKRTPIILIMQRLHEEDLAGWLLNGGNGEEWEHLCLPALRDDGTALWPDKHDVPDLLLMEQANPYNFAGQYQQTPIPTGGALFKPDHIEMIDAVPAGIRTVRAWDLAGTDGGGDYTAGLLIGQTPDKHIIICDAKRMQGGPEKVEALIKATASHDGSRTIISIPQDPGQAGKHQAAYLARGLAGYLVKASPETGDKVTRAEPFAAQVNVGNVKMVRGDWNGPLLNELRTFPFGKYDDQVDACSRAFNELTLNGAAMKVAPLRI